MDLAGSERASQTGAEGKVQLNLSISIICSSHILSEADAMLEL